MRTTFGKYRSKHCLKTKTFCNVLHYLCGEKIITLIPDHGNLYGNNNGF